MTLNAQWICYNFSTKLKVDKRKITICHIFFFIVCIWHLNGETWNANIFYFRFVALGFSYGKWQSVRSNWQQLNEHVTQNQSIFRELKRENASSLQCIGQQKKHSNWFFVQYVIVLVLSISLQIKINFILNSHCSTKHRKWKKRKRRIKKTGKKNTQMHCMRTNKVQNDYMEC